MAEEDKDSRSISMADSPAVVDLEAVFPADQAVSVSISEILYP